MRKILIILFLMTNFLMTNFLMSQVWDENFYDKRILYNNADLLQINEYEKFKLLYQDIKRNRNTTIDDIDFYDFDQEEFNNISIYENNNLKNKDLYFDKSERNSIAFVNLVNMISMKNNSEQVRKKTLGKNNNINFSDVSNQLNTEN